MMILLIKRIFCLLMSALNIFGIYEIGSKNPLKPVRDAALAFVQTADVSLNVNTRVQYQTISGFGASACWWAQDIGNTDNAEEVSRLLYSGDGLGLNIYRYNVGGGEKDNPNSRIRGNRATESFYYFNEDVGEYEFDFTRDAAAQKMLELALSYGCVDTVVLFANSPHYSMTVTGQATGGQEEFFSNLPEENYQAFADYFITITKYFLEKGVPVKYISPINEPQWSWGGEWVGQEGCHYEPDEILAVLKVFAKAIADSGLDVKLMAPESGSMGDETPEWFDMLAADEDIAPVLGSLSYHSYWSDGNTFAKYTFGNLLKEKNYSYPVDMTEWCELPLEHDIGDFGAAMLTANVIIQDIALAGVNSWSAWTGVNNMSIDENGAKWSDGLLAMNDGGTEFEIAQRYYALQHFSRFIPAGSVRVKVSPDVKDVDFQKDEDKNVYDMQLGYEAAAFKIPDGKIVVVIVNEREKARNFTVTGFGKLHADVWQSTAEVQMKNIHSGFWTPSVNVPGYSITTIILS